jgi:hypothetical protein
LIDCWILICCLNILCIFSFRLMWFKFIIFFLLNCFSLFFVYFFGLRSYYFWKIRICKLFMWVIFPNCIDWRINIFLVICIVYLIHLLCADMLWIWPTLALLTIISKAITVIRTWLDLFYQSSIMIFKFLLDVADSIIYFVYVYLCRWTE